MNSATLQDDPSVETFFNVAETETLALFEPVPFRVDKAPVCSRPREEIRSSGLTCSITLTAEPNPTYRQYLRELRAQLLKTTNFGRAAANRGGSLVGLHLIQPYEGSD